MKYRLFWWFRGADPERIGGPWWCKDFPTRGTAIKYLDDMGGRRIMHKVKLAKVDNGDDYKIEYDTGIHPPEDAEDLI